MVFVGDKKYACETCIKGHRSSSCKHTDRPLFEIKKKGRPVTQCEHCRELRKTRQIHVKCVCENKEGSEEGPASLSKGGPKLPARAAFPSGLPEELLEASVASQPFSEGSDSDQSSRGCSCKDGTSCTCWTPRNRTAGKRPAKAPERRNLDILPAVPPGGEPISQPAALVVHAHSGNNRPVLPKPPVERPGSPRASHDPSATQGGRSPSHGQSFYSPYSRAYGYSHGPGYDTLNDMPSSGLGNVLGNSSASPQYGAWDLGAGNSPYPNSPMPSTCGCGPSCACPGCVEHGGPNADPSAPCANPDTCVSCLDCNINTLTALAGDATRRMYDASGMQNVDDWLRQVSSLPDLPSSAMQPSPIVAPPVNHSQPELRYDPVMMQTYGMWNGPQGNQASSIAEECCGGRCECPAGLCTCPADCCGCCQGCQCSDCVHDGGSGRALTFATSGERAPCCGRPRQGEGFLPSRSSTAGPSTRASFSAGGGSISGPPRASTRPTDGGSWLMPTLTVPRTSLSRASSSSSKSSPYPSTSSPSPSSFGDLGDGPHRAAARDMVASMGNLSTSGSAPQSGSNRRGADQNEYRTHSSVEYRLPQTQSNRPRPF